MTIYSGDLVSLMPRLYRGYLKIIGFPVFGKMDIAKAEAWMDELDKKFNQ